MNKKAPTKVSQKPPLKTLQDERTRVHRTVNWVVSVILVVFAIWSINLNSEGRSLFKQSNAVVAEIDRKIDTLTTSLSEVKEVCQKTTVVVPVSTTENPKQ